MLPRVLVVDDSDVDREHVRRLLGSEYEILEAATVQRATALLGQVRVDCVVLDYRLPDGDGIGLLAALVEQRLPVLMLTAQGSEQVAVQALKHGARDYIPKHLLTRDTLNRAVVHAIERCRLELELVTHQERLAASNRALEEREAQLRVVLSQLPALVWTTDASLAYSSVNGAALASLGLAGARLVGSPVRGGVPGDDVDSDALEAHRRALAGESARYTSRSMARLYDCLVEPLRGPQGQICGTIGVALDTTEARRLEAELRQSQKLEAVGLLAGGVAHDFNNVLTAILGFAGFVKDSLPADAPATADIDQVLIAANRARALVNQLLAFSRRRPVEPRVFAVNTVLSEMSTMLRRLLGDDVELSLSLSQEAWNVRMDASGLEQVIANLSINARDAMPTGGRLTLATENLSAHEEIVLDGGRRVESGEHIVIFVTDTGTGIPPELRDRIFEPFFTTKESGRGTGLGLSTCHGIVAQAGGILSVRSEIGAGTTFCLYLPRAMASANPTSLPPAPNVRGGRETLLVVEDDDQVRAVIVRILLGLGYRVVQASGGRQAIELARRAGGAIDLVLTDLVMPELGGVPLVDELQRLQPSTRFLFMSGYSEGALRHHRPREKTPILHKPVTPELLARRVRAVLDSRR